MKTLKELNERESCMVGGTVFKFYPPDDMLTDTVICLNHERIKEEEEPDSEFKQRVVQAVYDGMKKALKDFEKACELQGFKLKDNDVVQVWPASNLGG